MTIHIEENMGKDNENDENTGYSLNKVVTILAIFFAFAYIVFSVGCIAVIVFGMIEGQISGALFTIILAVTLVFLCVVIRYAFLGLKSIFSKK